MIRLTVKQGTIVQMMTVDADKVFVGRLDTNGVRLEDPAVSRKHCLIRRTRKGELEILDLNSRHGTRMNGKSVERAALGVGDVIGVGAFSIVVEDAEKAAAAPTPATSLTPAAQAGRPARESKELLSGSHRSTFSEQLYLQFRRVPWWAASLCVHTFLVYLLFSVAFQPPALESPFGTISGKLGEDFSSDNEGPVSDGDDLLNRPLDAEAVPLPEVDDKPPSPASDTLEPKTEEPYLQEIGPGLDAVSAPLLRRGNTSAPVIPEQDFGKEGAKSANQEAVELVRRSLKAGGGGSIGLLEKLTASDLLVISGHYDRVETVLELLSLEFQATDIRRADSISLNKRVAVFINCSNEAPSPGALQRIRQYVEAGGYLITSDWGSENVLVRTFRGYVEPVSFRGRNALTDDEVIRIRAAPGADKHFLLAGTDLAGGTARWWLEESSYPFKVLKPGVVEVLIESGDLEKRFGTKAVAVTFRFGKGRILHMMGHFFQKEGNLKGAFSAQRLVANFLLAAVRKK